MRQLKAVDAVRSLRSAQLWLCEEVGTNNSLDIARINYSVYEALRILEALEQLVEFTA